MKICGIYCLTSPSGKKYIGQSMNINKRLSQYKRCENKNQTKIHMAILKYGWDSFVIEELFTIENIDTEETKKILNLMEQHFIKKFNSVECGYNLTYGGDSFILSDETKSKISKSKKNQGKGIMKNNKPVDQYSKDGNFIRTWDAVNYAGKELNISPSTISLVCRNKRKTAGGYIWKYHEDN